MPFSPSELDWCSGFPISADGLVRRLAPGLRLEHEIVETSEVVQVVQGYGRTERPKQSWHACTAYHLSIQARLSATIRCTATCWAAHAGTLEMRFWQEISEGNMLAK